MEENNGVEDNVSVYFDCNGIKEDLTSIGSSDTTTSRSISSKAITSPLASTEAQLERRTTVGFTSAEQSMLLGSRHRTLAGFQVNEQEVPEFKVYETYYLKLSQERRDAIMAIRNAERHSIRVLIEPVPAYSDEYLVLLEYAQLLKCIEAKYPRMLALLIDGTATLDIHWLALADLPVLELLSIEERYLCYVDFMEMIYLYLRPKFVLLALNRNILRTAVRKALRGVRDINTHPVSKAIDDVLEAVIIVTIEHELRNVDSDKEDVYQRACAYLNSTELNRAINCFLMENYNWVVLYLRGERAHKGDKLQLWKVAWYTAIVGDPHVKKCLGIDS